jgi:hypothetical protein
LPEIAKKHNEQNHRARNRVMIISIASYKPYRSTTMTIRLFATVLTCLAFSTVTRADVKEISLKGLKADNPKSSVTKPTEIKTAVELEKAFPQKDTVDAIKKEVDFDKQKLVFFAWSGSGGDKITATADKDDVTFTYKGGLTRDIRPHYHLFAIPKDAKFKVETGK